ncbi:hypothetical protein SBA4_1820003 [Candidatus Sulfopaludibacter sp. SbA4]|nr:hypothetical protein SBA4_1820003 [Candidatus Sulfopaludibacter sp. SbA4]
MRSVVAKDLALGLLVGSQPPDRGDDFRAEAVRPIRLPVAAVAAEEQLVLMAPQKIAGVIVVAQHRIQARPGGHVAVDVRKVRQQPVGDASRRDRGLRIHFRLVVILVDVPPPGLRVPDEDRFRVACHYFGEIDESEIVIVVLEVQEHRDLEFLRDPGHDVDGRGIDVHRKLLFADADGAQLEIFLQHLSRLRNIGQLVSEEPILLRVLARDGDHGVVAARASGEGISGSGGQKDGPADAHLTLVRNQFGIATAAVVGVLVDIDDRLGGPGRHGSGESQQESAAGQHGGRIAGAACIILDSDVESGDSGGGPLCGYRCGR